jgi:tetratricopeptide (TPR) repeat protein
LHQKSGDYYRVPLIKYYQGLGQIYQGYLDLAGQNLQEGLKLAQEQGQKSLQSLGKAWLGYYYLVLGLDETGLEQAQQSVSIASELGSPLYEMKAQSILGTAHRHLGQLPEAVSILEKAHRVAHDMGFTPDEVNILYQLARAYIDSEQWDNAAQVVEQLSALAEASDMREFIARSLWLRSMVLTQRQEFSQALDALVDAARLAEEIDGRLTQFLIQIQKANVYQKAGNAAAARDAMVYAQKIQKKLIETNLSDETAQQAFLNNSYSARLQTLLEANTQPL